MKYRKRVKLLPGVNLNISKSGISTTIGVKGASVNIGKKGTYLNTGIPGTGLYSRKKISNSKTTSSKKNIDEGKYYFQVDGKWVDVRQQKSVEFTDNNGVAHTVTGAEYGHYLDTGELPTPKTTFVEQQPTAQPKKKQRGCFFWVMVIIITFFILTMLFSM